MAVVGDVYRCRLGRTVTEADNIWFTLLTSNTNQIHFNKDFARRTEFGKCLINTSRGPCVQEAALIETLLKGHIGGAALDVFEEEPLALDSQLRNLGDRVLLSPHVVSNNVGSGLGPGIAWATESVLRALRGEVPDNVYNKEVIPRWERRFGGTSVW